MTSYHFKVRDRFQRILAENDIEEVDALAACRSVAMALAMFAFNAGGVSSTSIELDDGKGRPFARISLYVETL